MGQVESTSPSYKALLKHSSFLLLWLGVSISTIGNAMFFLALQWWVFETTGSPLDLTLLSLADALPMLVLAPFAGVWIDRWERKRILILLNSIQGILVLWIFTLAIADKLMLWHVYTTMFVLASLSAPLFPAFMAAMPDAIPRDLLPQANAFRQMSMSISGLVGYGVGGFVVGLFGVSTVILINALTFFAAAFLILLARFQSYGQRKREKKSTIRDLAAGIRVIWDDSVVRVLTGLALVFGLFYASIIALLPQFVGEYLHQDAKGLGLMRSVLSFGMLLGPLIAGLWAKGGKYGKRVLMVSTLAGLSWVVFSFSTYTWLAAATLFLLGFFDGIAEVLDFSILQTRIPEEARGRAFGFLGSAAMGARVVGLGIGGPLALMMTVKGYFILGGICITVVSLLGFLTKVCKE